jgi:hypothetical protein
MFGLDDSTVEKYLWKLADMELERRFHAESIRRCPEQILVEGPRCRVAVASKPGGSQSLQGRGNGKVATTSTAHGLWAYTPPHGCACRCGNELN